MLEIIILTVIVIIVFIAASWYAHQRSQARAKAFERELDFDEARDNMAFQQRFDALFEQEANIQSQRDPDLFDDDVESTVAELPESDAEAESGSGSESAQDEPQDWDLVVAFTIIAPEFNAFTGRAIKAALEKQDMHFGDMQIYHKYTEGNNKRTLFSAANVLAPGTLLPDMFVSMTSPGLLLFARFPGPVSGMALFDELLETAQNITVDLGGILCDETRQPITDEALEAIRSRIFSYQMSTQADNQSTNDYFD